MMRYFYFLKYAVSRRKIFVLYPKWCVQSDSEIRFWLTQPKMKKNWHFFHFLLFLTLKYDFFRTLSVTGSDREPYQGTISIFVYALKNIWVNILSGAAWLLKSWYLISNINFRLNQNGKNYKKLRKISMTLQMTFWTRLWAHLWRTLSCYPPVVQ